MMATRTKAQLRTLIKRQLGWPIVKLEISDEQIDDNIDIATTEFITWAVGQSTQETFFTILLSGGQNYYDMPNGVTEVISYNFCNSGSGGINTLFSVENYMFNSGDVGVLRGGATSLIDYHIGLDFLKTLNRYTPDDYNFKYHQARNILEIQPTPPTGNSFLIGDVVYDSPGFVLIRSFMIRGSQITNSTETDWLEDLYGEGWVREYAVALTKVTLGLIRRKFFSFNVMGTQGLALDGSELISEGKEEIEKLETQLKAEEVYEG